MTRSPRLAHKVIVMLQNRPFYSCVLIALAFDRRRLLLPLNRCEAGGDLVLFSNLVPRVLSLALGKSLETRLVSEVDRTLLRVNTSTFIFLLLKGLQIETNPESKIKSVFMQCYPCAFWHWPKVCPSSAVTYTLLRKKIVINMSENCKIQIYDLFLLFKRSKIWKFAGQNIMSLTANELVKYSKIFIKQCVIPKFKYIAICNAVLKGIWGLT